MSGSDLREAEPTATTGSSITGGHLLLEVVERGGDWSAVDHPHERAAAVAAAVAARVDLGPAPVVASLALVDDETSRTLNRTWRRIDKATNVLSFPTPAGHPIPSGAHEPQPVGDVVVAAGVTVAEATEQGISPGDHFSHLVAHGLLHLLGFDHETEAEAAEMEALERELLESLGIADPYGDGPDAVTAVADRK